ncbi:GH1 family beta-glucosidase [Termitidicoccus mucosus]|uniref:Beta-glucosidase n=1 Tax=Termitidicoccus mucosus TaxID=1184151 RepID=A0A178IMT4_9BACT|nr:beta-galactosidase [Opitutaceae bacterium TSB47]
MPTATPTPFAPDFTWGAATSAYQIEGAPSADGKGPSIWDDFSHRPEKIAGNDTGDTACDHYHRWRDDIALMRRIGLRAYRFSIAWARVLPEGDGRVNDAGLAFYSRLVDGLLDAGIQPWVTLYHWDLPLALHRRGGWLNHESVDWFGRYAAAVARALGDRVKHWITLNEPQCSIGLGLDRGIHAPGDRLSRAGVLRAWHHQLMAHGLAVRSLREHCRGPVQVGLASTGRERIPETNTPADIEAARAAYFEVTAEKGVDSVPLALDPVYRGRYPEAAHAVFGRDMPGIRPGDMELISEKLDFIGYNSYSGERVRAGADGRPVLVPPPRGRARGTLSWLNREDDCLYWAARFQTERYPGLPFVITENGYCGTDWIALDGGVHDAPRIDFTKRYLRGLARAAAEGVPVAGYFHWSLLDNFEWSEGYQPRFGLIHVDFDAQTRLLKDSALWFAGIIRSNGAALFD